MLLSNVPGYFKARRDRLMKAHPGAAFILPANREFLRNVDVNYEFRQESNFYYLTGFEEPESFLVLAGGKTTFFVRKRNPEMEMWEGERYGTDRAMSVFGADQAYVTEEFEQHLPALLKDCETVHYRVGRDDEADRRVLPALEKVRRTYGRSGKGLVPLHDPTEAIGEMRLFKQPEEIEIMRKVGRVSAEAHKEVMAATRPGMNEFDIQIMIDHLFMKKGCRRLGYPSIVAGGKNATCLHYRSNNETLNDGDVLLIDAGGEIDYYCADITRTFPVGRTFTRAQATIYDLVLRSQLAAIELAKPGTTLPEIHKRASEVLIEGMLSLGLLKGKVDELFTSNAFKRFYPHGTGHWLGMDVHDCGLYARNGEPRKLEPGMVFTIEPGFYVQPTDMDAPAEYRNIGVRIEDDILITSTGCEIFTSGVPKAREEVEALKG